MVHGQLHVWWQRLGISALPADPRQGRSELRRGLTVSSAPTKDDGASFTAIAISNPANAPKVDASFSDELAKTLKEGFTADEVAAAKKVWLEERP